MITTFNFNQPFKAGLHEKTLLRKARAKGISQGHPTRIQFKTN